MRQAAIIALAVAASLSSPALAGPKSEHEAALPPRDAAEALAYKNAERLFETKVTDDLLGKGDSLRIRKIDWQFP